MALNKGVVEMKTLKKPSSTEKVQYLSKFELYDLFRMRDSLEILKQYNLADTQVLEQVNYVIMKKV